MSGLKRFLVMHLDKVLLGVLCLWALIPLPFVPSGFILRSVMELSASPKVVGDAQQALKNAKTLNPAPPDPRTFDLSDRFAQARSWRLPDAPPARNVFFRVESLKGYEDETARYEVLCKTHACQRVPINDRDEICLFPGCQSGMTEVQNNHIGPCAKVQCVEATATTVTLEWLGPDDYSRQVTLQHCQVERRKSAEKQGPEAGWVDVMDQKGEPVKILGGVADADAHPAGAAPAAAPGSGPGGFVLPDAGAPVNAPGAKAATPPMPFMPPMPPGAPVGAPGARTAVPAAQPRPEAPAPRADPADVARGRDLAKKAGKPAKELLALLGKESEQGRELAKQLRNVGMPEEQARAALEAVVAEEEAAVPSQKRFRLVDFNLDTDTVYEYRIRAVGTHPKTGEKKGDWTEPLKVRTKEDRGMRFTSYVPSQAPGTPSYVTVRISKLYEPLWLEGKLKMKHFLSWDHAMIQPGVEKENQVGRLVPKFKIVDAQNNAVLYNSMTQSFMYDGDAAGNKAPLQPPERSTTIRFFRADVDFTTGWLADKVEERVTKKMVEERYMNEKGQMQTRQVEKNQYRYFLLLKGAADPDTAMELELERRDYDQPLIQK